MDKRDGDQAKGQREEHASKHPMIVGERLAFDDDAADKNHHNHNVSHGRECVERRRRIGPKLTVEEEEAEREKPASEGAESAVRQKHGNTHKDEPTEQINNLEIPAQARLSVDGMRFSIRTTHQR